MSECLDVHCIIRLLRNAHRPLDLAALMDDAATALERTQALPRVDDEMVDYFRKIIRACNVPMYKDYTVHINRFADIVDICEAAIAAMPMPRVDEEMVKLIEAFEAVDKATSDIRMKFPIFCDIDGLVRIALPLDMANPFMRASADFCNKISEAKAAIAALTTPDQRRE